MGFLDFNKKKRLEALWILTETMGGGDPGPVPRQLPTEASMLGFLRMQISGATHQTQDTLKILNSTANPDTFYPRVDFARQRLDFLCRVQAFDSKLLPFDARKILRDLERLLPRQESDMWQRAYDKAVETARQRKTREAQIRPFEKLFNFADQYSDRIGPQAAKTLARCRANMQTLMS